MYVYNTVPVEPRYNEVLGTMKITLLYQVSHYIRVKKQRNIKSRDQQNYLVIRGFCYIRSLYNEVSLYHFFHNFFFFIYFILHFSLYIYLIIYFIVLMLELAKIFFYRIWYSKQTLKVFISYYFVNVIGSFVSDFCNDD